MTDDSQPGKQPGRINSMLYRRVSETFNELYKNIRLGMKDSYPKFKALIYHSDLQSEEYGQSRKVYNDEINAIRKRYGDTQNMSVPEAIKRIQSVMDLLVRVGVFRLRDRPPAPQNEEADEVVITCFDYDTSGVPDTEPLVKVLTAFYFDELRKEFMDKPEILRKRAAVYRAKRTFVFYQKYREYEQSGFDAGKIEEIFSISRDEQKYLKFWLNELLYDGKPTALFASAGSGKSNAAAFIIQLTLVLRPEWDIITNVPLVCSPDIQKYMEYGDILKLYQISKVTLVEKMSEALAETAKCVMEGRIPALVLDEFDSALSSVQSRSKEGVSLQAYTDVERHIDTQGPLVIYHYQNAIPKDLRVGNISHQVFGVFPYSNPHRRIGRRRVISRPDFWATMPAGGMRYLPLPLTNLAYHNQGWSPYKLDVDMQWLNQQIGKATKLQAAKRIMELIPQRGWEKKDEKEPKLPKEPKNTKTEPPS